MPLVSGLLLPYEGHKPRGTGRKHCMEVCMWSIFLVMMRNHTCMTNPNPLLWFPNAADSFPMEYAATFYSLSCLMAYTVLGDWSWQFNSFCTENREFGYWGCIWCLDVQTLADSPDSIGERESQFWGALLAHEWEEALVGGKPLHLELFPPPHPALCPAWLQQQWYETRGVVLHPVRSLAESSSEFQVLV